jgi:hypothetical protein
VKIIKFGCFLGDKNDADPCVLTACRLSCNILWRVHFPASYTAATRSWTTGWAMSDPLFSAPLSWSTRECCILTHELISYANPCLSSPLEKVTTLSKKRRNLQHRSSATDASITRLLNTFSSYYLSAVLPCPDSLVKEQNSTQSPIRAKTSRVV